MSTRGEMSRRRRRRRAAPRPASLPDNEDMLREILLRLPPRPSSLPRASLVCKRWRSLVTDPQFQRRFRDHHGKPPLLGFFLQDHRSCSFIPMLDQPDRIPGARFSMPLHDDGHIIDCRHGLVLFLGTRRLLVWDPVAGEQRRLISPPELDSDQMSIFHGGVLRPAGGQGCRSSRFQVALMARDREGERVSAYLYSSETGIWGNISSLQLQLQTGVTIGTSTLTGNSLCWLIRRNHQCVILEFDLDRQTLALRELPPHIDADYHNLRIMPAEDGGLGFIHLSQFHAQLWKRVPDSDGLAVWVLYRAIDFEKIGSTCRRDYLILQGFAEENNAVLVRRPSGVFLVYLQSMEFKELSHTLSCYPHYPFACCYAAGTSILNGHDGDEVLNM